MNDVQEIDNTQFKDIDEALRYNIIVKFLIEGNQFKNKGDIPNGFNCYKTIFYFIQPKNFKSKEILKEYTNEINNYLETLGSKPVNMAQKIQLSQSIMDFKDLVEEYFQLIPEALDELGLYLKVIKRRDDYDESFSIESFNSDVSLLDSKKEILKQLSSEQLVFYMMPSAIHDTHARIVTDLALHNKMG